MKILHIGKFYPPFHGGMENYLRDLAQEQSRVGHEVTVWVHNHDWHNWVSKTTVSDKNQVNLIRQKSLRPVLFTPIMLGFGRQLKKIIQQDTPDLIHLHWPNPSLFKLLLNRSVRNIPIVISWHSDMVTSHSSVLMKLIYMLIKPLESLLIKRAKSLLVSSQAYADHSKQLSKHVNKTKVIPLGMATNEIDCLELNPLNETYQLAEKKWQSNRFRLLHVGRLTFYKNQTFLLNALQKTPDCQLIIAGEGQMHQVLEKHINHLLLQHQVKIMTGQNWQHIHGLFATCDVFCMASHDRAESFGMVLIEAMYHGKVILVPDTIGSGMQWLATHYPKGYVYKVNDSKDFVDKIAYIRENMTEIMAKPIEFNYQIQTIAESIFQHYTTVLERGKQ